MEKQKFDYDCGTSCIYNYLLITGKDYDYSELLKALGTTEQYGTHPDMIEKYFIDHNIEYSRDLAGPFIIALVDYEKFNTVIGDDYGHYVLLNTEEGFVFDPWTGELLDLSKFDESHTLEVKAFDTIFNNVYFSFK